MGNTFHSDLRVIAEHLARHEKAVQVSPAHIDKAYEVLGSLGLRRSRWIDRPEAMATLGALLVGFAFACPDAIAVLVGDKYSKPVSQAIFLGSLLGGVILHCFALARSRWPEPPASGRSVGLWVRRIALWLVLAAVVLTMVFLASLRLEGCCGKMWWESLDEPTTGTATVPAPAEADDSSTPSPFSFRVTPPDSPTLNTQ